MPRRRAPGSLQVVCRTARAGLRVTRAQRRRLLALLVCGGDLWACVLEINAWRQARQDRPLASYQALCWELARAGPRCFGELDTTGARSVLRRYSDAWFAAAKRRAEGDRTARFPRRRRALMPLRWYHDRFMLEGRRLRIPVARGRPALWVRLDRDLPYPPEQVRSVTLLYETGRLWVDVTAEVPVARRAPKPGQRGSRRWRHYRRRQRLAEARHRRRVRQAQHEAAKTVIAWAVAHRAGTLAVGDPRGVLNLDAGRRHNQRTRDWRIGHLITVLKDKAQAAGISLIVVDERGTSSTCSACRSRIPKPAGRVLTCPACQFTGHRDLTAAANIAGRHGGGTTPVIPADVTHRRAGAHLPGVAASRRDPRRRAHHRGARASPGRHRPVRASPTRPAR